MKTTMKPFRVPIDISAKYSNPIWFFLLMVIWALPLFGVLLLDVSNGVLIGLTGIWVLCLFLLLLLPLCYDLVLFPEGAQIRFCWKVIQQIPLSEMKMIYGVGTERLNYLCLSMWDTEELVQRREAVMKRGYFSRQDLLFMKKSPGWQEKFAKEYLLNPTWRLAKLHTKTPILWLPFDPVIAICLRRMYPQLPYVDLRSSMMGRVPMQPSDQIPFYTEHYRADEEGVHFLIGFRRKELRCFPAERIKTIFRVDRFVQMSKIEPGYTRYLVISELSVSELAQRGKQKGWQKWKKQLIEQLPEAEEMYAAEFHFSGLFTWNWKTATDCHIMYTPETEEKLRQLYPHACWVDYSKEWQ